MSRRAPHRATALVALGFSLAGALLPSAGPAPRPAAAQEAVPTAQVTLAAIDPVVAPGTQVDWSLVIEQEGDAPWARVEVVAELHGALGSRSALRAALAGGAVPPVVQRAVVVPDASRSLVPGTVVRISGTVPLVGSALSGQASAVHPLRLRVLADGSEVGRIDTAIVRVGAPPTNLLATTLVWPLDAPPARGPDGDPSAVLDPLTRAGGRLDTLVTGLTGVALGDPAGSPTSLADGLALGVPAHLLEDLALRGDGVPIGVGDELLADGPPSDPPDEVDEAALRAAVMLQRLRTAARGLPGGPLVTPYGDADLGRLLASGVELEPLAARAVLEGAGRTPLLLGRDPASVLLLSAPVAPGVLDLLPSRTVLLPHAAIEAPDLALDVPLGEPVRTLRSPSGRLVTALVGDPYLTVALGGSTRVAPGDPVRAAHEVLVRTAMIHLEAPGRPGRSLILLPPADFDPDPRFVAELLTRLAEAPWLAPTAPDAIAAAADAPEPALLVAAPFEPLAGRLSSAILTTQRDLELLVGAVDPEADLPGGVIPVGRLALRDASDELLRATSRASAGDVDRAVAQLAGVRTGIDAAFGTLTLGVSDVTLTDRDGTVPITLERTGGVPLQVRLEVTGPAALTWTDGRVRELTLGPDASRSVEVPVRAGGTGRFPVTVRVTDPTGGRVLASEVVGVRATALAGPALVLIGATVLVLGVIGTLRQRRRGLAWRTVEEAQR